MTQTLQPGDEHATIGLPLAERLPAGLTAVEAFRRMACLPHVVFFDSATPGGELGRYSFVAADPFAWFEKAADGTDALSEIEQVWQKYRTAPHPDLPPFQGGLAGLLGYELARSLERIPAAAIDDLPLPALAMGCYDTVVAFDHEKNSGWIISQGLPETEPQARRERATARLHSIRQRLLSASTETNHRDVEFAETQTIPSEQLAEQFRVGVDGVTSTFSAKAYRRMVRQAVEYIHAGDVFQVNLAQRLLCRASASPVDLYLRMRKRNPAPYAGYLNLGNTQICSASPECFLTVRGRQVETRPIKGTRGRSPSPEADLFAGDELQLSAKDRAENVMIVDLMRNDLSRVCSARSVHVAQLCRLENYAFVKHLVSVVRGELRGEATPVDLLRACFPGGSITGAPKVRAMEIIASLEPTTRGAYCGSLGYFGFDGQMDTSILIRTLTAGHGWWQFPVGGGIVAQSDPEDEYRETWHKAEGLLQALRVESPRSRV